MNPYLYGFPPSRRQLEFRGAPNLMTYRRYSPGAPSQLGFFGAPAPIACPNIPPTLRQLDLFDAPTHMTTLSVPLMAFPAQLGRSYGLASL